MDQQKIEKAVRDLLIAIGENPHREGLLETPQRVAKMYQEVFSSFFKIFMTRIRNARRSQKRSAIISNRIAFVKHYFRLFSTFFVIYHKWYKQR